MAKQGKVLPPRRHRAQEALLIRSAESLGRIIGALQRQLDDAGGRLSKKVDGRAKSVAAKKTAGRPSGARKAARKTACG